MNRRQPTGDDKSEQSSRSRWHLSRDVPVTWLVGGLLAVCAQAATVYFAQQQQSELLRDLAKDVKTIGIQLSGKDLKDVEHDILLKDHERRLTNLEQRKEGRQP